MNVVPLDGCEPGGKIDGGFLSINSAARKHELGINVVASRFVDRLTGELAVDPVFAVVVGPDLVGFAVGGELLFVR